VKRKVSGNFKSSQGAKNYATPRPITPSKTKLTCASKSLSLVLDGVICTLKSLV